MKTNDGPYLKILNIKDEDTENADQFKKGMLHFDTDTTRILIFTRRKARSDQKDLPHHRLFHRRPQER